MGTSLTGRIAGWIASGNEAWRSQTGKRGAGRGGRVTTVLTAIAGACLVAGAARAVPVTYDLAKEFSITNGNPNGTWTYGWEATGGGTFIPFTQTHSSFWPAWAYAEYPPAIQKNTSSSTAYGVAPGQVSLHPGIVGQPSIARWTAPAGVASSIVIDGQFFSGDVVAMAVGIFLNNNWTTPLFQASDAGAFHLTPFVSAGDTIDFAVYGGYTHGNTPLDARITVNASGVPEIDPAGLAGVLALVTGALGIVERRGLKKM